MAASTQILTRVVTSPTLRSTVSCPTMLGVPDQPQRAPRAEPREVVELKQLKAEQPELASAVDMTTSFTLEESPDGTVVYWQGDVTISGKLAAFGPQGLLDRIARKNVDAFIQGIRSGLQGAQPGS